MEKFNDQIYNQAQFKNRPQSVYIKYAQIIQSVLQPQSILDLGCANGYALAYWQQQGIKVAGIEPAKAAYQFMPRQVKKTVKQLDLRSKLNLGRWEVVNFTEVAEHIDKKYQTVMLDNVIRSVGKYLIISWSNEPNKEHVNPRSLSYVRRHVNLFYEPELTLSLKNKLSQIKSYHHWAENIQVFSRLPQSKRILCRHFEWHPTYANKNIGYFIETAEKAGFSVRKVIGKNEWGSLFKHWHRVWLYPFEPHLLVKLVILKLFKNKIILKLDSIILPKWRAWIIAKLTDYILVESPAVGQVFPKNKPLIYYQGGLSQKNIDLIKRLKVKRGKQILFSGRPVWQKGIDRFKKIRIPGWKTKIVSNLSGANYYREILRSSIIVLPTRGEGWPNVFQDAWFCKRLFLTTTKAKCQAGILKTDFYTDNINLALKKIIKNLDWYYKNYERLYDATKFAVADKVFLSLIKNQG